MIKWLKKVFSNIVRLFRAYNDLANIEENKEKAKQLDLLEHSFATNLQKDYISYQANPSIEKLHRLMVVVSYCQLNNMNGKTKKIQEDISNEWVRLTGSIILKNIK